LLLLPLLALTYVLGGIINTLATDLLKHPQSLYRDRIFRDAGFRYSDARSQIYQQASPDMMARFRSDGHIIRVARGSALNFVCLGIVSLLYLNRYPYLAIAGAAVSAILAAISLRQWQLRYRSNYTEMLGVYKLVRASSQSAEIGGDIPPPSTQIARE